MDDTSARQPSTQRDIYGLQELLQLVAKKISSQILLFSLAVLVLIVTTGTMFGANYLVLIAAILFVSVMATIGYLFVEEKRKLDRGDETVVRDLVVQKMAALHNRVGKLSIQLWTTPATCQRDGARDVAVVAASKSAEYRIGAKITVWFCASHDCYLTLFNIGTSGKVTMLFPNALHQDNLVRANELYQIPGREYGFEYQLQGPPGVEKLKAIATLEKVELLEAHFTSDGPVFETRSATAAARDIAVMKRNVEMIPSAQWAEASWEFRVSQ